MAERILLWPMTDCLSLCLCSINLFIDTLQHPFISHSISVSLERKNIVENFKPSQIFYSPKSPHAFKKNFLTRNMQKLQYILGINTANCLYCQGCRDSTRSSLSLRVSGKCSRKEHFPWKGIVKTKMGSKLWATVSRHERFW